MIDWHEITMYVRQVQGGVTALRDNFGIPPARVADLAASDELLTESDVALAFVDLAATIEATRTPPPPTPPADDADNVSGETEATE